MSKTAATPPHIVLASSSPRRRRIFELLQIPCELASADVDERAIAYRTPWELATKAAYAKALEVADAQPRGTVVIGVDTIVTLGDEVFCKPTDEADARRMLGRLAGRTHVVISAVAVVEVGGSAQIDAARTRVRLRSLTPAQIADYVSTGEPMDKAGSYALQGVGKTLVAGVGGDYFNVVGLPVEKLLGMLSLHMDVSPWRARMGQLREQF